MAAMPAMVAEENIVPASNGEHLLTAEEYYATCAIDDTELINGKVFELMPPGGLHGEIASILSSELLNFVRKHKLGKVFVEAGFRLTRDPDTVRAPDVSFVEKGQLPGERSPVTFIDCAPTLAVEVNSPDDSWSELEEKVLLYLRSGTKAVWIVDPKSETITVRTQNDTTRTYGKEDVLPGEPFLPGFTLPVKDVFEL